MPNQYDDAQALRQFGPPQPSGVGSAPLRMTRTEETAIALAETHEHLRAMFEQLAGWNGSSVGELGQKEAERPTIRQLSQEVRSQAATLRELVASMIADIGPLHTL